MEWYHCIISGKVQGVFYRKFVSQAMMQKQFKGYIRNLQDGTVEVVAEIFDDDYDIFMAIMRKGSPMSRVDDIVCEMINDAVFETDGFEIRY